MGNQNNNPQKRRYQQSPFVCCGNDIQPINLQQQSPNFLKFKGSDQINQRKRNQKLTFQDSGSSSWKDKDLTIYKRQQNTLQNSTFHNTASSGTKDGNLFKPITQQSSINKNGFSTFKKPTYGAFNAHNHNSNASYNSNQLSIKQTNLKEINSKNVKPTPMIDQVGQKQIKNDLKYSKARQLNARKIGQVNYSGSKQGFDNNKKIIEFLSKNYVKQASYKFYETKDDSFLLNNSTVKYAKGKNNINKMNEQSSTNSMQINQNLAKLQEPIQLTLQVDARILIATCLLIIGVIVVILGSTVFYSQTNVFICLMLGIVLYVCYLIICYIYNDVLQFLFNVKPFDQFQTDYKKIIQTQGQFAYHLSMDTSKKYIKECYILSKDNKYIKVISHENQNKNIQLKDIKNKNTQFLMVKYKAKIAFADSESQLNTINYFNDFLNQHKSYLNSISNQNSQKYVQREQNTNRYKRNNKAGNMKEQQLNQFFKKCLVKTDFNYQLNPIKSLTEKQQSAISVCYMQDQQDRALFVVLFVLFTLLGLCLPFLCVFQAYTKRYRINILNRFKVG